MEDGIVSAPATYSAPSAYYSPHVGRMSGLEILKGSSQVKYGPHNTGGVINYLSTEIPEDHNFYAKLTYGSDGTFLGHSYYGDVVQTEKGTFGYLLEMFYSESDGFRDIQGSGTNTGFQRHEPMLKLFWEPDSAVKQRFEFKVGYTDFDANESYLGLTEADRRDRPYDRYAASQFDNIDSQHTRAHFKWLVEPSDDDEAFFDFNDTDWGARAGFDQNRLFLGPQWRFDAAGRVKGEVGYLNRYARRDGAEDGMDHLVSINLLTRF